MNYEPSSRGGLAEADESYREYRPFVAGQVLKAPIERTNDYQQPGERYRTISDWERDDLVLNLVTLLSECDKHIQERMVAHVFTCDAEFGSRVADGIGISLDTLDVDALVAVR